MGEHRFAARLAQVVFTAFCLIGSSAVAQEIASLPPRTRNIQVREPSDLEQLESRVQAAVRRTLAATVSVRVGRAQGGFAFGSGVIVSEDGYVLTAAHVSSEPNQKVIFRFNDGTTVNGITLGLHKDLDMGLMKITDSDVTWPHLKRARSSRVETGDWVIATGYPGGFDQEAPAVVRLGRVLKTTGKVLLTDCTLVGGDSGGPLVDINGNVVGIHSRIGAKLSINLHVPIDRFAESWDRLASRDVWGLLTTERPWIGVDHNDQFDGAVIGNVNPTGPANRANLQSGDEIVRFDGQYIKTFRQLRKLVSKQSPGERVVIEYKRNGSFYEETLKIGKKVSQDDSQTRDDADLLQGFFDQIGLSHTRSRAVVGIGKNADQVKESFDNALTAASRATVRVIESGNVVAYGTIIDDRLIVTKASLLKGTNLRCRYRNSRSFSVEKVSELRSHDLALLKSSKSLPKAGLQTTPIPTPGSLIASSDINVWPLAIGAVSTRSMPIPSEGKLGIKMRDIPVVVNLIPGGSAEKAGIRVDDLITAVDGRSITTDQELIDIVQASLPGDVLTLTIQRSGALLEYPVELFKYSKFDEALADFEDFQGGPVSDRKTGFSRIVQHDTPILPRQCGGPVVDIHGRFVGINIARATRTSSYLMPANELKVALQLLKENRKDKLVTVDVGTVND